MRKFEMKQTGKTAELLIYEDIGAGWFGGITAKQVAGELKKSDATHINVRLNSSGGDVFEGVAIYNSLRRHTASISVDIDGAALSIASVIAMAADAGQLRAAESAFMMVHNPWSVTLGGSAEHVKKAELLDEIKLQIVQIYQHRTGLEAAEIEQLMNAETWMSGNEAFKMNFVDEVTGELAMAARVNRQIISAVPVSVAQQIREQEEEFATRHDLKMRLDKWTVGRQ